MSILKTRENDVWKTAYGNYIKNFLDNNKNLADISDAAQARKNLELADDNVINHNHDTRYLGENSMLKREEAARTAGDLSLDNDIEAYCNYLEELLPAEQKGWIQRKLEEINTKLMEEENNSIASDENIKAFATKRLSNIEKELDNSKNKKVVVPNSNVRTNYTTKSSSSTSYNSDKTYTVTSDADYISPGIDGGIYKLTALIDKLADLSHEHTISNSTSTWECNCNCNDSRCCGGGGH